MNATVTLRHTAPSFLTSLSAALLAFAALTFTAAPANAIRIPADPVTFVATPPLLAQLVTSGHAANVLAAIEDLRADVEG